MMPVKDLRERISIKDVARAAGTSISTVSRALNDHPDVSEETRDAVLGVARRLGYERNIFAHSLVSGKSGLLAIVVHEIDNDYHLQLLRGMTRAAQQSRQEILFSFTESREETLATCTSVYRRGVADGALVFSPIPQEQVGLLRLQEQTGFPIVVINPSGLLPGLSSIFPTDAEGAADAMRHLISLGHRRIAFVTESIEWGSGASRLVGYKAMLAEHRIPLDKELILYGYSGFPESGRKAARRMLDERLEVTAVLCFNDLVAYGLIQELNRGGVRVPQDISVVGFDDIPNSQYYPHGGLTTVRQPIVEIGEAALEMLVDLIGRDASPGQQIEMPMQLIVRGTTAPAAEVR
jgi:LacI family transcriptional regulator